MKRLIVFAALAFVLPLAVSAGQAPVKDDYSELSRLLHKMVVKNVPREYEQKIDWGKTRPFPPKLRFPNLRRNVIKVGDHVELANGAWKRVHVKLADPDKDLRIKVKDVKKLDKGGYRVVIDAEALVHTDGEWNQWLNGLLLFQAVGQADVEIATRIVSDVQVDVNFKKFPPEVKVEPKIIELALDLKDFRLNELGGTLQGERVRQISNDLMRDLLRDLLKASEPIVKDYANKAIADALKENHGKFSAVDLLKAAPREKK